jgi:30S ribosomal protein S31
MGKGDKRTRKGKISAGSYGKSRPKPKKATVPTASAEEKPKTRSKKKAE